jgi:hypothetical protein
MEIMEAREDKTVYFDATNTTNRILQVLEQEKPEIVLLDELAKLIFESPRDVTYGEMLSITKVTKSPIELAEAARMACQNNEQIKHYLGTKLNVKDNSKLRNIHEMLLSHVSIKQVNYRPIVLLWSEGRSGSLDHVCNNDNGTNISLVTDMQSDVSEARL